MQISKIQQEPAIFEFHLNIQLVSHSIHTIPLIFAFNWCVVLPLHPLDFPCDNFGWIKYGTWFLVSGSCISWNRSFGISSFVFIDMFPFVLSHFMVKLIFFDPFRLVEKFLSNSRFSPDDAESGFCMKRWSKNRIEPCGRWSGKLVLTELTENSTLLTTASDKY